MCSPVALAQSYLASLLGGLTCEIICSHNSAVRWVVSPFYRWKEQATTNFSELLKFTQHLEVWGLCLCDKWNVDVSQNSYVGTQPPSVVVFGDD